MKKFIFLAFLGSTHLLNSCISSNNMNQSLETNEPIITLAPNTPFDSNTIDGILATVGDQVILFSDFQQAIQVATQGQSNVLPSGQIVGGSLTPAQANQVLDGLINQKVLQVKAVELGFDISEDELESRIQEFLKQRGLTESSLQSQLSQMGRSVDDYRSEFKNELLKQQVIGRIISPQVTVTDDEINNFYLQQTGSVKQVSTVKLRSLLLKIPENLSSNPNSFRPIQDIEKGISAGEDFTDLVKKYSMASDATETEGLLPPRSLSELPPVLREKLSNLKINQVVGPIYIGSSAFFFQYLGANFSTGSDLEKNYGNWKAKLQEIKFTERLGEYLNAERSKLRANVRPFVLAK
ncbi:SurA N-terminal domain-containing protein [Fluviispira multicolorata]|nr:SurA N-terminal domain-containing protein [Fluviispira multicolorata]